MVFDFFFKLSGKLIKQDYKTHNITQFLESLYMKNSFEQQAMDLLLARTEFLGAHIFRLLGMFHLKTLTHILKLLYCSNYVSPAKLSSCIQFQTFFNINHNIIDVATYQLFCNRNPSPYEMQTDLASFFLHLLLCT